MQTLAVVLSIISLSISVKVLFSHLKFIRDEKLKSRQAPTKDINDPYAEIIDEYPTYRTWSNNKAEAKEYPFVAWNDDAR